MPLGATGMDSAVESNAPRLAGVDVVDVDARGILFRYGSTYLL